MDVSRTPRGANGTTAGIEGTTGITASTGKLRTARRVSSVEPGTAKIYQVTLVDLHPVLSD